MITSTPYLGRWDCPYLGEEDCQGNREYGVATGRYSHLDSGRLQPQIEAGRSVGLIPSVGTERMHESARKEREGANASERERACARAGEREQAN
jgi:hypothetical protein